MFELNFPSVIDWVEQLVKSPIDFSHRKCEVSHKDRSQWKQTNILCMLNIVLPFTSHRSPSSCAFCFGSKRHERSRWYLLKSLFESEGSTDGNFQQTTWHCYEMSFVASAQWHWKTPSTALSCLLSDCFDQADKWISSVGTMHWKRAERTSCNVFLFVFLWQNSLIDFFLETHSSLSQKGSGD